MLNAGWGVFACRKHFKGSFLLVYHGVLIKEDEARRREKTYDKKKKGSFMFYFKHNTSTLSVDATKDTGTLGRLANDAWNGADNCLMKKVLAADGSPALCLFAKRDINIGEELRYDYGVDDLPWRSQKNDTSRTGIQTPSDCPDQHMKQKNDKSEGRNIEATTTEDKTASKNQATTENGYRPALMKSTSDQVASKMEKQYHIQVPESSRSSALTQGHCQVIKKKERESKTTTAQDCIAQTTLVPMVPKSAVVVQPRKGSKMKPRPTHEYRASKRQRRSSSGHDGASLPETHNCPAQVQRHVTPVCKNKKEPSETTNDQVRTSKVTIAVESTTAMQPKICKKVRPQTNRNIMAIERQRTAIGASSAQGTVPLGETQSMPPTAQSQVTPFVTMPTGHSETTQVPVAPHTPAVVQIKKRKKIRPPPNQTSMAIERQNTYIGASSAQGTAPLGENQRMPSAQSQVTPFVTMHRDQSEITQVPVASHKPALAQATKRTNVKVPPSKNNATLKEQQTDVRSSSAQGVAQLPESPSLYDQAQIRVPLILKKRETISKFAEATVPMSSEGSAVVQTQKGRKIEATTTQDKTASENQAMTEIDYRPALMKSTSDQVASKLEKQHLIKVPESSFSSALAHGHCQVLKKKERVPKTSRTHDYNSQTTLVPMVPKSAVEVQPKKSSEVKPPPTHDYRASKRQRRSSSDHGRAPLPETPSGPAQSQRHVTPVCKKKKDPSETTNDQVRNSKVTMAMESSTATQPKKCK
ncbi:uncharacterized protein LOC135492955 [Lineus longissimus]|uniref:uncharacterized protein LOC135492955 n=1 Tax=Lineus longissimus TaxID=88925 RepID=UPI00315D07F1